MTERESNTLSAFISPLRSRKMFLQTLLGLFTSGLFIYLVFRRIRWEDLLPHIRGLDYLTLALVLVSRFFVFFALVLRWRVLLKENGRFPFWRTWRAYVCAFTLNNLLPFRLGELFRLEYMSRMGKISRVDAGVAMAVERLMDLLFLLSLSSIMMSVLVFRFEMRFYYILSATTLLGLLAVVLVGRNQTALLTRVEGMRLGHSPLSEKVRKALASLIRSCSLLRSGSNATLVGGATLLQWFSSIVSLWLILKAFRWDLPAHAPLGIFTFIFFASLVAASPGMVGTYEYFTVVCLGLYGVSPAKAISFAIVAHSTTFIPYTLVGCVLLLVENIRLLSGTWSEGHKKSKGLRM